MFRRALVSPLPQAGKQPFCLPFASSWQTPLLFAALRHGATQLGDMPSSTTRKPKGPHRGPGKRQVGAWESSWWKYVKRWELEMDGTWDGLENFQHLPKPKKLLGNEAAEIVWPYAVLLENVIKIHPFCKSLYCYYPQHALSGDGANAAHLARRFSRECMVPICFHNSQCYVETELLLEHGDTAWIVVHCLDGRHEIVCVNNVLDELGQAQAKQKNQDGGAAAASASSAALLSQDEQKRALLQAVLAAASRLGSTVKDPSEIMLQLNQRPLQNAFIRVDYQWMGDTVEERQSHLVRWLEDPDERGTQPVMYERDAQLADWLNDQDGRGTDTDALNRVRSLNRRSGSSPHDQQVRQAAALSSQFNRYSRVSPQWGKGAGAGAPKI